MNLSEIIKQKAVEVGFDLVGITAAEYIGQECESRLKGWLDCGGAAEMGFMHRNLEKRVNPGLLLEGAKSVICLGVNYKPGEIDSRSKDGPVGRVADYALYEDYHGFMKKLMRRLCEFIVLEARDEVEFKICVDTVPIAERAIAAKAGLGFIGRNHSLINPRLGCEIFLGEIITTLELEADGPIASGCDGCDRCVRACPTGALGADGDFDAGKCISYLTIESREEIPVELQSKLGMRLFGCDECLRACPYQKKGAVRSNQEIEFYSELAGIGLEEILAMGEEEFEKRFGKSSLARAGLGKLKSTAFFLMNNE